MPRPTPPVVVIKADPALWEEGVQVVLAAQAAAGPPGPAAWSPEHLAAHTRRRHATALGVWVALAGREVIGHGLLATVQADHPDWAPLDDAAVATALAAGAW